MATLVFSAVGTALGGPLGGALGALIGNQLDRAVVGSPKREGRRLKELAVTTSSYGTAIPRHFGHMRAPGTVIWATDLHETKEKTGGSKGAPSITTYAYSVSFAVALASRPIQRIGRIWADGNLLRGAGGDLKVGGQLRVYNGHGDQDPDPLIASDRGAACPAFRDSAYCVFEDLQLADFGNRIPSLTFEIIAGDGAVTLADLMNELGRPVSADRPLSELVGFSDEGGPIAASLATLDQLYPMTCDGSGDVLRFASPDESRSSVRLLPEPVLAADDEGFGGLSRRLSRRQDDRQDVPDGLRYYDVDRDYQAGMQRALGRARPGRTRVLEFPGALQAGKARQLCNALVQRAGWSGEQLLWRVAEIDPALAPGQTVAVPGLGGAWRIDSWEWRADGIELELSRLPPGPAKFSITDPGAILPPKDERATPTILRVFELPWGGVGSPSEPQVYVAASSTSSGWTGAALYAGERGALSYLQPSGSRRSTVGHVVAPLEPSTAILFDQNASIDVRLVSEDFVLTGTTMEGLANGLNRILIGGEVLQFARAAILEPGLWRLSGLLRGRGGTEAAALAGHQAGASFVLLDEQPFVLDPANNAVGSTDSIAAIGLADDTPVLAAVENRGLSKKPLVPVHPRVEKQPAGAWTMSWTRRARGAWSWPDTGEIPLQEQSENYIVGVGDRDAPSVRWETQQARLVLDKDTVSQLLAEHAGKQVWVRQVGTFGMSDPLLLAIID